MKKEEEKSLIYRAVRAASRGFKKILMSSEVSKVVEEVKEEVEDTLDDAKKKISDIVDHLTSRFLSFSLIIIGIVFGLLGVTKFLSESVKLGYDLAYLIVGLVVLIIGWLSFRKKYKH